ncbi:MFS-type transporter SLC18B1-like [Paramacrobiotus metropolitanus]|uniref:MFS-type transporter SLC18B1-like n=1 Tax=Paramacrobiotus metropolitanus TaxID=2943436 RepID=UPI0024459D5F|nr:MFS-type transporter SLC18B1-like [Paramacrobiotus metropolitanus]
MLHDDLEEPDVWSPKTSWILPSLHRSSRRLLSDVGRAARYASGSLRGGAEDPRRFLQRSASLDGLHSAAWRRLSAEDHIEPITESQEAELEAKFSFLAMSRNEKLTLLCLAVVDMFSYLCMSIMSPFFPIKVAAVGASQTISGAVFAVYALTVFLASPVFAKLIPVLGAKFTFIAGVFLASGCNFLFGFLEYVDDPFTFTVLAFAIRIVEGVGAAGFCTASFSILAYEFSGNVAVVFGTLESFVGIGMTAGPALGGFLYSCGGFKLPFFIVGSIMFLTVPLNMWLLPTQEHVVCKPKKGSRMKFFKNPSVYVVCLTILIMSSVWGFLDPTLEPHLEQFNLSSAMVGLVFLLISASYAIFSPLWGWIAEKVENTDVMMVLGLIIAGVTLLFLGPSRFLQFLENYLWVNLVCLSVLGAAISMALIPTFETLLCIAEESGMEENMGTYAVVSGVWGSAYSLGEVVGPALGGYLDDLYGFEMCSTVMASCCLGVAVLYVGYKLGDWVFRVIERKRLRAETHRSALASWRVPRHGHATACGRNNFHYRPFVEEDGGVAPTPELPPSKFEEDENGEEFVRVIPVDLEHDIPSIAVSV